MRQVSGDHRRRGVDIGKNQPTLWEKSPTARLQNSPHEKNVKKNHNPPPLAPPKILNFFDHFIYLER